MALPSRAAAGTAAGSPVFLDPAAPGRGPVRRAGLVSRPQVAARPPPRPSSPTRSRTCSPGPARVPATGPGRAGLWVAPHRPRGRFPAEQQSHSRGVGNRCLT